MIVKAMNHITLGIVDAEKSFAFYRDIVGLKPLVKWDKGAYFLVGDEERTFWFCLNVDRKRKPTACYTHYAFSVNQESFKKLSARIIESGTKIFKKNTSQGDSLYFLDPDGHKLEIHVGNWHSRIEEKKANLGAWDNVEWFV